MKNKGFVFVETIIVITVLTVALLAIYSTFLNVLTNEKRRATYNDTAYLYRTYYIEDFMVSLNLDQYIDKYLVNQNRKIVGFSCSDLSLYNTTKTDANNNAIITDNNELAKETFCETVINSGKLNVKNIYITKYDVSDLKKCTSKNGDVTCTDASVEALKNAGTNFAYYLRTLSSSSTDTTSYRLIVEYEETENDYTLTSNPINGSCANTYALKDNICVKEVIKDYYSSIKIVKKGEEVDDENES